MPKLSEKMPSWDELFGSIVRQADINPELFKRFNADTDFMYDFIKCARAFFCLHNVDFYAGGSFSGVIGEGRVGCDIQSLFVQFINAGNPLTSVPFHGKKGAESGDPNSITYLLHAFHDNVNQSLKPLADERKFAALLVFARQYQQALARTLHDISQLPSDENYTKSANPQPQVKVFPQIFKRLWHVLAYNKTDDKYHLFRQLCLQLDDHQLKKVDKWLTKFENGDAKLRALTQLLKLIKLNLKLVDDLDKLLPQLEAINTSEYRSDGFITLLQICKIFLNSHNITIPSYIKNITTPQQLVEEWRKSSYLDMESTRCLRMILAALSDISRTLQYPVHANSINIPHVECVFDKVKDYYQSSWLSLSFLVPSQVIKYIRDFVELMDASVQINNREYRAASY